VRCGLDSCQRFLYSARWARFLSLLPSTTVRSEPRYQKYSVHCAFKMHAGPQWSRSRAFERTRLSGGGTCPLVMLTRRTCHGASVSFPVILLRRGLDGCNCSGHNSEFLRVGQKHCCQGQTDEPEIVNDLCHKRIHYWDTIVFVQHQGGS